MPVNALCNEAEHRPWAIRRWCLVFSLIMAGITEIAFIIASTAAYLLDNGNIGIFLLPFGWPLYYAILYGISYGIAIIDQGGTVFERFPRWYQDLFPSFVRRQLNAWYTISPNFALIAFSLVVMPMSGVVAWAALTGKLNP